METNRRDKPGAVNACQSEAGFTIRRARSSDRKLLVLLWRKLIEYHAELDPRFRLQPGAERDYDHHISGMIRGFDTAVFVAELANGEIVGYMVGEVRAGTRMWPGERIGFISDAFVEERWRRCGAGNHLVEAMENWFQRERVRSIELYVADANPISQAFWRKMGFGDYMRLWRRDL